MNFIKSRFVPKVSIWLINLLMIGLIILFVFKSIFLVKFYQPLEPLYSFEGVETWSTDISLEAFGYKLKKELTYISDRDKPLKTAITFTPPFYIVGHTHDSNSKLSIRPLSNSDLAARADDHQAVPVEYVITESDNQFWFTTLYIVIYMLSMLIMLWWFWLLRKLVKNIADGKFFIVENARKFIYLAIPLLSLPFVDLFARMYSQSFFVANFQVMKGGLFHKIEFEIMPIVFGLTFLIIGGIVNEGAKMKQEQDLTI